MKNIKFVLIILGLFCLHEQNFSPKKILGRCELYTLLSIPMVISITVSVVYFKECSNTELYTARLATSFYDYKLKLLNPVKKNICLKTRRGSPIDRRPSTAETPPIGQIYPFNEMAVTFEPGCNFDAL